MKTQGRIECDGFWYEYEYKSAKDNEDICLGTEDPEKYCNGIYLYSTKDPGNGLAFVVIDSNDPVFKKRKKEFDGISLEKKWKEKHENETFEGNKSGGQFMRTVIDYKGRNRF